MQDALQMIRLWTHEVLRVFYDRLIDDDDRMWVGHHLSEIIKLHFKEKVGAQLNGHKRLIWGWFTKLAGDRCILNLVEMYCTDEGVGAFNTKECADLNL